MQSRSWAQRKGSVYCPATPGFASIWRQAEHGTDVILCPDSPLFVFTESKTIQMNANGVLSVRSTAEGRIRLCTSLLQMPFTFLSILSKLSRFKLI